MGPFLIWILITLVYSLMSCIDSIKLAIKKIW